MSGPAAAAAHPARWRKAVVWRRGRVAASADGDGEEQSPQGETPVPVTGTIVRPPPPFTWNVALTGPVWVGAKLM